MEVKQMIPSAFKGLAKVAKRGYRAELKCIHITENAVEVADGFMAVRVQAEEVDGVLAARWSDVPLDVLVTAPTWTQALTLMDKVEVMNADGHVRLADTEGRAVEEPKTLGKFGDVKALILERRTMADGGVVNLNPDFLMDIAQIAKALKASSIRLQLSDPAKAVRVDFNGLEEISAYAAVMPMWTEETQKWEIEPEEAEGQL